MTGPEALLSVRDLVKDFQVGGGAANRRSGRRVHTVRGVSLDLAAGEVLGLVGESGSGKSTIGRCVLRLVEPTSGTIRFMGQDVLAAGRSELRRIRQDIQMVFQDASSALDPRMTVSQIVSEPLEIHGTPRKQARSRVGELLAQVGLEEALASRFQHQLSGGQRQRVGVARALALEPRALILDEPVSALDVSVRAGVLALLEQVRAQRGLAYLLISHDLAVVADMAHRVAIVHLGTIVETGSRAEVFQEALHPYTQALIASVPVADPSDPRSRPQPLLSGEHPSPVTPPSGCGFRTRCWKATQLCADEEPALACHGESDNHLVACHHPGPTPS